MARTAARGRHGRFDGWALTTTRLARAALALVALAIATASRGEVIISEIMYNPDGSDTEVGASKEWIELYNAGDAPIDLAGWTVADVQDGQIASPLPSGAQLAPGGALVVTGDAAAFDAQWNRGSHSIQRVEVQDFPTLANSPSPGNETVALRSPFGSVVDSVNYDDQGAWPRDSPDGASITLLPQGLSSDGNDEGAGWKPSMWGVYGARFEFGPGGAQDRASPGVVAATPQAPFQPSPDAAWSMVVLPDTQAYVKSSVDKDIFTDMTQWIVDHHDEFNVQFVLHEGDIVNQNSRVTPTSGDQSGDQQWQNAKAAMSLLDGVVPYAMAPGNHDYGTTNAQNRSTQFNDYFKREDNPLVDPQQGGTLRALAAPRELDNALHEFTAPDGRQMLVLTLEWGPRQQRVDWADRAVGREEFADHTAVLVTHAYMHHDETRYDWSRNQDGDPNNNQGGNPYSYPTAGDTNDGEDLWRELVSPNQAFEMVFSGHVGSDGVGYLASRGERGQTVHQMLFNTQFESYGGNGWLRVVEFLDDGRTVRLRTYSPFHDLQKTDPANAFEYTISPLRPGDYNDDGVVDAADYAVWRDNLGRGVPAWSSADGDGDGLVGAGDYHVWRNALGDGGGAGQGLPVPQPAAGALLVTMMILLPAKLGPRTRARISPKQVHF